jgi:hypothetical protein
MTHYVLIANLSTDQHVLDKSRKDKAQMGYHPRPPTCFLPPTENVQIKQN